MAKKKKRRVNLGTHFRKPSKSTFQDTVVKIGEILVGLAAGSQLKALVEKKDVVSGTDLLGLDGETSKITTPALVLLAGGALALISDNKHLENLALGITVSGAAGLVNNLTGKSVVALGSTDENAAVVLPGVGAVPMLPGIGNTENAIPENYDYSLNPALIDQPAGDFGNSDEEEYENVAGFDTSSFV